MMLKAVCGTIALNWFCYKLGITRQNTFFPYSNVDENAGRRKRGRHNQLGQLNDRLRLTAGKETA